jgi:hypothetical protein
MLAPRAEIARERRRMVQVRQALAAGLDRSAEGKAREPGAFYLVCADYLGFSMGRLYQQDGLIHELLSQRIPGSDRDARQQLTLLGEQQQQGRRLLEDFTVAARDLRDGGHAALPSFKAAARGFLASFNSAAQAGRNPFFRYTDALFDDADWERIAGVTPASIAEEARLFAAVRSAAPAGAEPEQFTAGHSR